jgi:catechol 2,3-dioxygenase-like lactoylglutathione lyase family enzyme
MRASEPAPDIPTGFSRRQLLLSLPAFACGFGAAGSAFGSGFGAAGSVLANARSAVAQTPAESLRVRGMNHVRLSVSDVTRTVDFYQGLFGMPVISRQGSAVNLQIGAGPQFLEIAPASGATSISELCLGVEGFDADRVIGVLRKSGLTDGALDAPLQVSLRSRNPDGAKTSDAATREVFITDPDGIRVQLQDPRYCGGSGVLGDIPSRESSLKKGLIALRDWSHCTIFGSDGARANKFYQDLFGLRVQAYQGPGSPVLGLGGVQFLMLAGAGGRGRGRGGGGGSINHLCMNMDGFVPEAVIKTLESYGIKPRGQGAAGPLVHYISMRMANRGGAPEGTPELYFTDPDGLLIQLQDTKYCGGGGVLGDVCTV